MGLLDDAIREHLDLKRARGGDPAEIERMEREALGPVRREPTFGATRFPDDEPSGPPRRAVYPEDESGEYLGYRDSTVPHDDSDLESAGGPYHHGDDLGDPFDHEAPAFGYVEEEQPAPRRRFLRRHRSNPTAESRPTRRGFRGEPADDARDLSPYDEGPYEGWPHPDEPHAHGEFATEPASEQWPTHEDHPYAEPAPGVHAEDPGVAGGWGPEAPEGPVTEMMPAAEPPPLEFDRPPKRPRFTAEPPSLHSPEPPVGAEHPDIEPPTGETPAGEAPPPPPPTPEDGADHGIAAQETTEFDVATHIAETRHLPDEPPPDAEGQAPAGPTPAGPTPEEPAVKEDVLEETPDFLQDTPEHDRLWFEQRPPRDFDF